MPAPSAPPRITGFEYVRPLGAGGFAHVYLYEQDIPRRMVAVKVLQRSISAPRHRSEFEAEADAMARLSSHPSIVTIHAVGLTGDGKPYLAMEYCPESMRELTRGTPAHLQTVLDTGIRMAGALESAHRGGVLHRDIKPSNILLSTTGRPALTDFGISALHGREVTEEAARAMSIPWAAPEVLSGESTGSVASEVWSLGATLYTFAAGRSPFESPDRLANTKSKMIARITKAKYVPVPGARGYEPFDEVIATAMRGNADDRFASMRLFGEALQQVQRGYGLDVTPLDILDPEPAVSVVTAAPRGPVVSSVRATTRAARRRQHDEQAVDRDGIVSESSRLSQIRAGLLGAGIAVAAVAVVVGAGLVLGWFG